MAYQPSVYLAGPIQHAADRGKGWRARIKQRDECDWRDPFDKYDATTDEGAEWSDEQIVQNDLHMIDACRALLVHWEEVPTCGTPMEIRYAYERDIFIVVQTKIPTTRLSPWLTYHASTIVETFDEAIDTLEHALWADRSDPNV
jgi:nucleoside 2-deoxyribosyltransferase